MSSSIEASKARPYSADVSRMTKVRLQSSNCPTIVKHEVTSPSGNMQLYGSPSDRALLERPRTANNATKMKFAFLQSIRPISSPMSAVSMRPQSGPMNSTINFDFVNSIGKATSGKFKDKSKIKPMKKLNTDQFHNIIYQVKHQKELLEKDINRMEQWQRDFKENDIWSTPQSAIIESILQMNARANPDGSVSRYLQNEKEKGDTLRNSRKFQQMRPSSAFNLHSNRNIKSVKDFFRNDDNEEEVIDEVLSSKNPYYTQYEANKKRITEKMNAYVDNYNGTDNTLRPSNKDARLSNQPGPNTRENVKNWKPYEVSNQIPQLGEENTGKSISEIVESFEDSENSPAHLQRLDKKHSHKPSQDFNGENNGNKGRPVSAMVTVNTVLSPKNFMPAFNRGITSPPGPLVMHSRPHTAKAMRIKSPGSVITESLAARGEASQPSISGIKYLPFRLEGQRLGIGAENVDVNTYNEMMHTVKSSHSKKASNTMKTSPSAKDTEGFWPGSTAFKVTPTKDFETGRTVSRNGGVRIKSAKKVSRPNTASTSGHETPLALGKVNIDGQYLMNFADNNRTPLANF